MPYEKSGEPVKRDGIGHVPEPEPVNPELPPNGPASIPTQPVSDNSVENAVQAIEDRVKRAEWLMITLTAVIGFFAFCQVIVGIFQWDAMRGQLSEMKSSGVDTHNQADRTKDLADRMRDQADRTKTIADQAIVQAQAAKSAAESFKRAADLSFMQAEGTQAAIIRPALQFADNQISFSAFNTGHMIANDVTAQFVITRKHWPSKVMDGKTIRLVIPRRPLTPPGEIAGSSSMNETFTRIFSKQEWNLILAGEYFVTIEWSFSYENGFRRRIEANRTECLGNLAPVQIKKNQVNTFGPILIDCGHGFDEWMTQALRSRKDAIAESERQK